MIVTRQALLELALIPILLFLMARSMHRRIGFDTHGSARQWLAALVVGLVLAGAVCVASPERFLTAGPLATTSPYSSPLRTAVAGAATAAALVAGMAMMFLFDRQLGRFWLYRLLRVFGRGVGFMFAILIGIRAALMLGGARVAW